MPARKSRSQKPCVVSLVGARPQFVKLAPLTERFKKYRDRFNHIIVHSGQHYDATLSQVFFDQLKIPAPDVNLRVGSGSHAEMTAAILSKFEKFLIKKRPALVAVYGDTNTTLSGALAAVKLGIPVAHIEAGLRSFDLSMPEEINRRTADHISSLLLCPTLTSAKNLKRENALGKIAQVGDLMYELLSVVEKQIANNTALLNQYNLESNSFALLTAHRPATVDTKDSLLCLLSIIERLVRSGLPVLFPVHPRALASLKRNKLLGRAKKIRELKLIAPLSYQEILTAAYNSAVVVTDSGGLQKEAVFLGKKCLTLRENTEWIETLKQGNYLVGLSVAKLNKALRSKQPPSRAEWKVNGKAPSELIAREIWKAVKR